MRHCLVHGFFAIELFIIGATCIILEQVCPEIGFGALGMFSITFGLFATLSTICEHHDEKKERKEKERK